MCHQGLAPAPQCGRGLGQRAGWAEGRLALVQPSLCSPFPFPFRADGWSRPCVGLATGKRNWEKNESHQHSSWEGRRSRECILSPTQQTVPGQSSSRPDLDPRWSPSHPPLVPSGHHGLQAGRQGCRAQAGNECVLQAYSTPLVLQGTLVGSPVTTVVSFSVVS